MTTYSDNDRARFASYVQRGEDPEGCHIWIGGRGTRGHYGSVRCNGRANWAHRAAYEMAGGEIPKGRTIRHTCLNKLCVNPAHLVLNTAAADEDGMGIKLSPHDVARFHALVQKSA